MAALFDPLTLRGLTLRNRIVMAPMCQYSATTDGIATDWHRIHYPTRAIGGVGLVLVEATAVEARGRISDNDLGIWSDAQVAGLGRIVELCHRHGAAVGLQIAHAGRKAWSDAKGVGPEGAVAPSAVPFDADWQRPRALEETELPGIVDAFRAAAGRALAAGFDLVEIHGAHGYLLHQFLSPLSNHRTDGHGGDLAARARLGCDVVRAVREVWPADRPLWIRVSATDWADGGLGVEDVAHVAGSWKRLGVDVVHVSSGGLVPAAPPVGPGYQVPFAERIRAGAGVATCAVGLITEPAQAEAVVREGRADLVALGRQLLRDPYWPLAAARALGAEVPWPKQYLRAKL